jgi:hypothetical protein
MQKDLVLRSSLLKSEKENLRMKNAKNARLSLVILSLLLLSLMGIISCGQRQTVRPALPPTKTPPPPTLAPPTQPAPQADLAIVGVHVEKSGQGNDYRKVVVDVRNNGAGAASGFDIVCNWTCPAGLTTSWGTTVEQGAYIGGQGQFTYRREDRMGCTGPPAVLNFVCTVDVNQEIQETREGNNQWQGQVNIPF